MLQKKCLFIIFTIIFIVTGCFDSNKDNSEIKKQGIRIQEQNINYQPILLTEFESRWNAISDEITLVNSMIKLVASDTPTPHYLVQLDTDKLYLKLFTNSDNTIAKIQVFENANSTNERILAISAWWQVMLLTNDLELLTNIDSIFAKLGIGPNGDLSGVDDQSFSLNGKKYSLSNIDDHFLFEVAYSDTGGRD